MPDLDRALAALEDDEKEFSNLTHGEPEWLNLVIQTQPFAQRLADDMRRLIPLIPRPDGELPSRGFLRGLAAIINHDREHAIDRAMLTLIAVVEYLKLHAPADEA